MRAICLMGPTASGKTACAIALAKRLPVEIINVDSAQVYRGMDIGTAKPSPEVLQATPHRLIDIRDPWEAYSAGAFCADASNAIQEIVRGGRIPLLVGGTMLYFQALQRGIARLPAADPILRAELDQRAARDGWPVLHAELQVLDPIAAARLKPTDAQRIQRAERHRRGGLAGGEHVHRARFAARQRRAHAAPAVHGLQTAAVELQQEHAAWVLAARHGTRAVTRRARCAVPADPRAASP